MTGPSDATGHGHGHGNDKGNDKGNDSPRHRVVLDSTEHGDMAASLTKLCERHLTNEYNLVCDRDHRYPTEAMEALAHGGWAALAVPAEHGGEGATAADLALVLRTVARHSLAAAQAFFSLWILGAEAIARLGTPEQKTAWLPRLAQGRARVAFAMTEPEGGSDVAALRTVADLEGGQYVLNGQKVFITGAQQADTIITLTRTRRERKAQPGLSLLLVDPQATGLQIRPIPKIGLPAIDLGEIFLQDVRVPAGDLLGQEGQGWAAVRPALSKERLMVAAICVGALSQIVDLCTGYAQERRAFGAPLSRYQLITDKIVGMRVDLDSADLLVARAAAATDAGEPEAGVYASIAKLVATRAYVSAAREGSQVFGGYGFTTEYPVARHYRDAKYLEIGGGTSEIQKGIISRSMGLQ